jgi:tight adherence protein B
LKDLEARQKADRKKSLTLTARLEQAGLDWSPTKFWIISGVLGGIALLLAFMTGQHPLFMLAAAVIAGFGCRAGYLSMSRNGRQKKFTANFADALDVIVRGIKSGLPLNECLKIIAREAEQPVRGEFEKLVEGIAVGVDSTRA